MRRRSGCHPRGRRSRLALHPHRPGLWPFRWPGPPALPWRWSLRAAQGRRVLRLRSHRRQWGRRPWGLRREVRRYRNHRVSAATSRCFPGRRHRDPNRSVPAAVRWLHRLRCRRRPHVEPYRWRWLRSCRAVAFRRWIRQGPWRPPRRRSAMARCPPGARSSSGAWLRRPCVGRHRRYCRRRQAGRPRPRRRREIRQSAHAGQRLAPSRTAASG